MMVALAAAVTAVSCEPSGPEGPSSPVGENSLTIPNNNVPTNAGTQYLIVSAVAEWTLALDLGDAAEEWVNVSTENGRAGTRKVVMAWKENEAPSARVCRITLTVGEWQQTLPFTQRGRSSGGSHSVTELNPDPVPGWLELPATDDPNLYFFTHDMTIGGETVRNYSFYLDPEACLAVWVAYPLNDRLAGSGSRTDAWAIDPKVPRDCQPVLFSGFGQSGIDRGHQLPSADRLRSGANEATFYGTNMTPQYSDLNQKSWAYLEGKVRTWASSFDTLYVVTGCDLRGFTKYAYDNDSKPIPIPTGYFKALLGFKKKDADFGNSVKQGGYTAVGFYVSHQYCTNAEIMQQSMTIDELEEIMDMDFFPNLEAKVGSELYAKIESIPDTAWK